MLFASIVVHVCHQSPNYYKIVSSKDKYRLWAIVLCNGSTLMFRLFAGSGSLSVEEAREGQLIEQYYFSQFTSPNFLISNQDQHHTWCMASYVYFFLETFIQPAPEIICLRFIFWLRCVWVEVSIKIWLVG